MTLTTVTITIPQRVKDKLLGLAQIEGRSAGRVFESALDAYQQTTKPETKPPATSKWPFKLIPEGYPLKVLMDDVMVIDHTTKRPISLDHVAVSFSERKVDGALSIVASVSSEFIDYYTGEHVPYIIINTPGGSERITSMGLNLLNEGDLVRRWLDGLYDSVDNWEQHVLRIVRVKDGRPYVEMAPIVPGRFVPSEEQYEEYRKDREWSEEQIEKFIELRSQVVPGGPDWLTTLNGLYAQVDRMV